VCGIHILKWIPVLNVYNIKNALVLSFMFIVKPNKNYIVGGFWGNTSKTRKI